MTEKRIMKLASRGKRFGAACIDSVVPIVSYLLYTAVMAANGIRTGIPGYGNGNDFGYGYGYGYGFGYGYDFGRNQHLNGASAAIMLIVFIILLAYIVFELILFAKGKTIGKAALGLQVVSSTDGKPFGFWKMVFRECFVKSASGSVFGLGYIWILLDEKNRGWHDKILDSYVVDLKESERMNLRRKLEKARVAAPEVTPEAEPVSMPEADERVTVTPEVIITEEPVTEMKPEAADAGDGVSIEETAEFSEAEETAEVPATENISETSEEDPADMPELSMSMKKEELLEAARMRGVQVSSRATKAAIIEAIEKATEKTDN